MWERFFWREGDFLLGAISIGKVVIPSLKIVITLPKPMRSHPVKENHISSVVSEIFPYKQTKRQIIRKTSFYFIIRIRISKSFAWKKNIVLAFYIFISESSVDYILVNSIFLFFIWRKHSWKQLFRNFFKVYLYS